MLPPARPLRPTAPPSQVSGAQVPGWRAGAAPPMPIEIPLSLSGPAAAFATALEAHRAALESHRAGKPGVPMPVAHPLLDSLIAAIPRKDPLPDDFVIAPYTIFDDTPAPPTLEERKAGLLYELIQAGQATRDAILSPARANLLNLNATEAMSVAEETRTPDQVAVIAAYVAFQARAVEIAQNAAHAAVEIEDLSEAGVDTWKVPAL